MDIISPNIVFHIILALFLLYVSGFIGKNSMNLGYASMARAYISGDIGFNLFYRALFVPLAICFVSALLFLLDYSYLTQDIWLTAVYFFILQTIFSFRKLQFTKKGLFFGSATASIILSYFLYSQAIIFGLDALLPEGGEIATELWILVVAFFYGLLQNLEGTDSYQEFDQKLENKYLRLKDKFKLVLKEEFVNTKFLNDVLFSVMIFEDFNRPKLFRFFENFLFRLGFVKTTGIMQVKSDSLLDDYHSVVKAQDIIFASFHVHQNLSEYEKVGNILIDYNADAYYRAEVRDLYYRVQYVSSKLEEKHFSEKVEVPSLGGEIPNFDNLTVHQLDQQISALIMQINDLQTRLMPETEAFQYDVKSQNIVNDEEIVLPIKCSFKIQQSGEIDKKVIGRGVASDLEMAGHKTLLREEDWQIKDEFSEDQNQYDLDLSLTINLGPQVITLGLLISIVIAEVTKGFFTQVGKDIYLALKRNYFTADDPQSLPCIVEIVVKSKTSRKNVVRVYLQISNPNDLEHLASVMLKIESEIQEYYNSNREKVLLYWNGNEWVLSKIYDVSYKNGTGTIKS